MGDVHQRSRLGLDADPTPADWRIPGLFTRAGLHDPDLVLARHDHAFDSVQESFAAAACVDCGGPAGG